jgi:hypothetical protein
LFIGRTASILSWSLRIGSDAMIQTNYDAEADVLHVKFGPDGATSDGATEVAPGVFLEFPADGTPIGIEVLSLRLRSAGSYHATTTPRAAE